MVLTYENFVKLKSVSKKICDALKLGGLIDNPLTRGIPVDFG